MAESQRLRRNTSPLTSQRLWRNTLPLTLLTIYNYETNHVHATSLLRWVCRAQT